MSNKSLVTPGMALLISIVALCLVSFVTFDAYRSYFFKPDYFSATLSDGRCPASIDHDDITYYLSGEWVETKRCQYQNEDLIKYENEVKEAK